nr:CMRF35-like molecule 9 isoform X2 [Manis javanica]
MQPLTLLWGCLLIPGCRALMGPKEIRGFEGDTVSLQCIYKEELRTYKKYWCRRRGFLFSRCSGAIYVEGDGQERTEGRVSIQDRPQELTLKVTLRNLTLQDAGNYFCGVKKLGPDETFMVSLLIFPGPCCPPSPAPSFQPLATTSLQPKAKAWQTQPPGLTSPGLHATVTTAQQGKTGAEASPFAGTSLHWHAGTSPHIGTSPSAETSPHEANSPHAGTSRPASPLDPTSAGDAGVVPSSSSKSRVHVPMIRILAPVLVLLTLLLAAGLAALGSCVFRWRKEAQLATEAQRNKKVQLSHLPLGKSYIPEYALINLAGPTGPHASLKPSASRHMEIQCLSQTSEEDEAPSPDLEGDMFPGPPHTHIR